MPSSPFSPTLPVTKKTTPKMRAKKTSKTKTTVSPNMKMKKKTPKMKTKNTTKMKKPSKTKKKSKNSCCSRQKESWKTKKKKTTPGGQCPGAAMDTSFSSRRDGTPKRWPSTIQSYGPCISSPGRQMSCSAKITIYEDTEAEFHVISSQGDGRSFRVLCVCKENGGAQVAVVSPDNREWQISPTAGRLRNEGNGTLVNGFVYWASADGDNVLNTATLQFSQIDLPADMTGFSYNPEMSKVGETNDGKLCVVRGSADLQLDVWVRRAGKDGVDKWTRDKKVRMVDAIDKLTLNIIDECPSLNVVAIVGGIVYVSIHQKDPPIWLVSFCLKTRELKKLCPITRYEFCYPYIMSWPPSLARSTKAGEV